MHRVHTRKSVLFCIDVEAWEADNSKITEIGIAIYDPRHQELASAPNIKNLHLTIAENHHLRNGKYVPDNKQNFMGPTSYNFKLSAAIGIVRDLIDRYFGNGKDYDVSLVGHGLKNDVRWLKQLGVSIPNSARELDTQSLYSYTHGQDGASLKSCLKAVNQPVGYLHNAGNDAYFTVMLALKLCDPHVRAVTGFDHNINGHIVSNNTTSLDVVKRFS